MLAQESLSFQAHESVLFDKPFFIKLLSKKDVVSKRSIENPGLLGYIGKISIHCNATLQQGHLEDKTEGLEIMLFQGFVCNPPI